MKYNLQHNGKGKYHLIPKDMSSDEVCKSKGNFLFTHVSDFQVIDNKLYELYNNGKVLIDELQIELEFCKKCIKKVLTP